jgi:hypothetical protein
MCCASRPPSARSAWRRWKRERQHLPDRPAPLGESSGHGRCPLAIALHNTPPSRWHTALRAEGDDARPSPARADSHQEGTPTSTVRSTSATSPHIVRMGEASGLGYGNVVGVSSSWEAWRAIIHYEQTEHRTMREAGVDLCRYQTDRRPDVSQLGSNPNSRARTIACVRLATSSLR